MKLLSRELSKKKPEIILVVCEDKKSSTFYLEDKAKSVGISIIKSIERVDFEKSGVEIHGLGKDPSFLVKKAIERKNNFREEQKKKNSYFYSKVYCVMDVDDHPKLEEALESIKQENLSDNETEIIPIVSNECFEIWYVLHFMFTTRELYRNTKSKRKKDKQYIASENNLSKLIEKYLGIKEYDKGFKRIFSLIQLKGSELKAIKNAEKLNKHYLEINPIAENEIYKFNPSTQVHKLIIKLNELTCIEQLSEFQKLSEPEISQLYEYSTDFELIQNLWNFLFESFPSSNHTDRFLMLKEIFIKPGHSKAYITDLKIRDFLDDYFTKIGS